MDAAEAVQNQHTPAKTGRQGDLSEPNKRIMWGRAGGRCQRCNSSLENDPAGWRSYNLAENAHIVGSSINAARGDAILSALLADKIDNHLLLCQKCHTVIDSALGEKLFPMEALFRLKADQESRVRRLMDLAKAPESVAIYLTAAVGNNRLQPVDVADINKAIIDAGMIPAMRYPIVIDLLALLKTDAISDDPGFWQLARKAMARALEDHVLENTNRPLNSIEHFSVFGIAPIPVLALFGSLLPDTRKMIIFDPWHRVLYPEEQAPCTDLDSEIHQFHRDNGSWCWPTARTEPEPDFQFGWLSGPQGARGGDVAMLFELTFPSHEQRVRTVLPEAPCYRFFTSTPSPNLIQSPEDVHRFTVELRKALNEIERTHGPDTQIHVFGTLPVSCAIALGRVRVAGSLPMTVYHLSPKTGGYVSGAVLART